MKNQSIDQTIINHTAVGPAHVGPVWPGKGVYGKEQTKRESVRAEKKTIINHAQFETIDQTVDK